jgi:hypothetical protein
MIAFPTGVRVWLATGHTDIAGLLRQPEVEQVISILDEVRRRAAA